MVIVLKYGGNAMARPESPDTLLDEVAERVAAGDRVVLVHGGGPQIDAALAERGLSPPRIHGLRVTDAATLAVAEHVLCGTVNKALVRALFRRGVRAAGVSGQDGALLQTRALEVEGGAALGFVGVVAAVNPGILEGMFVAGLTPVVAPIGISEDGSSAFNINADTAAGAIAGALGADAYVVVTNVERIRRVATDPATGIHHLTSSEARRYIDDGTFDGGMAPKVESVIDALERGARRAIVCGSGPGAIGRALAGDGTTVVRG